MRKIFNRLALGLGITLAVSGTGYIGYAAADTLLNRDEPAVWTTKKQIARGESVTYEQVEQLAKSHDRTWLAFGAFAAASAGLSLVSFSRRRMAACGNG